MNSDPILDELYAAKEALAAKYNNDLHQLAEAFRRSPKWTPVNRPARPIRTAQTRLRMLTDPGDEIRELRKIKEQIAAENDHDIHKIGEAIRKFARQNPLPPAAKSRKLLNDFPRNPAEVEAGKAFKPRNPRRKQPGNGSFRSGKPKTARGDRKP